MPTKEWKAIINELYGTRRSLAIGRSIGCYQKLLHIVEEKRPEDVETMGNCYVNIGVGYNLLDDAAKAEKCWQKAIDLNEDDFAYCYLGWCRKRMGREDEAIVLLNKAIAKNERYAVPYFRLGKIRIERKERHLALRCFTNYLRYVDKTDPWIQEEISFAEDYIEVHNPPSEILLEVAKKRWKEKEAKMETPVKNDTTSDPGTAIESGKPHTVQDEKELHELFITCWDQSVGSSSYKKSSWKEMREFFWRFGWRV